MPRLDMSAQIRTYILLCKYLVFAFGYSYVVKEPAAHYNASGGLEPTVLKTPSKAKTETIAEGYALQPYKTISLFCMLVYNAEPRTFPDN